MHLEHLRREVCDVNLHNFHVPAEFEITCSHQPFSVHFISDEKVHTRMDYFSVSQPQSVTADGLFQVLEKGLQSLGI